MTRSTAVLILLGDPTLADNADRVAAAVGLRPVRTASPARKMWRTAAAVILDEIAARDCVLGGLPRRPGVMLVTDAGTSASAWSAAIDIGAQRVCSLPAQESELVRYLAEAADCDPATSGSGRVIAVTGGRGGGGASIFAATLALRARGALLLDLDPIGGGLDLVLGAESIPGLRWPDLNTGGGRLSWASVRDALPCHRGVSVLSGTSVFHEIDTAAAGSVLDAACRTGVTVICDVPRQLGQAGVYAVEAADLVCVVTPCDVRGIAGAAASAGVLRTLNPNVGLVVRGPAPGGLQAADAAEVVGAPLLAAMRAEPAVARDLEQGGLRLRPRSALANAARAVLEVLARAPEIAAA